MQRALSLAENALAYASLNADRDGVVTAVNIEVGQVVTAGQPAVRVAYLDEKEILVAIPESVVAQVRQGSANASLWAAPTKIYPVTLRELSPAADPATRTYAARYAIPNAGPDVQLGMTATLTLADAAPPAARLPLAAIFDQGKGPNMFVVDAASGMLTLKPIEIAGFESNAVLVRSGIAEGDLVVALGTQKLDPAQKVRVVTSLTY